MTKLFILAATFVFGLSSAFAAPYPENPGMIPQYGPPSSALEIQFISIGTGIDQATKTLVEAKIRDADEENVIAKQTTKGWGLEGEVTICLLFERPEFRNHYLNVFKELASQGNEKIGFEATVVSEKDTCLDEQ